MSSRTCAGSQKQEMQLYWCSLMHSASQRCVLAPPELEQLEPAALCSCLWAQAGCPGTSDAKAVGCLSAANVQTPHPRLCFKINPRQVDKLSPSNLESCMGKSPIEPTPRRQRCQRLGGTRRKWRDWRVRGSSRAWHGRHTLGRPCGKLAY